MREIERKMLYAVRGCRGFRSANTEVKSYGKPSDESKMSEVYLHGNLIYMLIEDKGIIYEVFTLAGWNTNTTRSRLRALLQNGRVYQKDYKLFCNVMQHGVWIINEIDDTDIYCISNNYMHDLAREKDLKNKLNLITRKLSGGWVVG
jgi:hypothetical protein